MALNTCTRAEADSAGLEAGHYDRHSDITNPHGAYTNWKRVNNLYNPAFVEEERRVTAAEEPLAYKAFVIGYLEAQGWKR